jgi:tRNA threonylcarbamoyladenosine biosynthesis protein TsaE
MKTYQTYSSKETHKLARELARKTAKGVARNSAKNKKRKCALVFALSGELGSGKTTFVQGFLRGLGIKKRSASPTFIIMRKFGIKNKELRIKNVYHADAYRIKNPRELIALGIKDIFSDPKNIVLVEWADKIKKILPRGAARIKFSHGKKENGRIIKTPS